ARFVSPYTFSPDDRHRGEPRPVSQARLRRPPRNRAVEARAALRRIPLFRHPPFVSPLSPLVAAWVER
ncbi:MAG: hypothetical protein ACYCZU_12490, partial [Devosia sp.]